MLESFAKQLADLVEQLEESDKRLKELTAEHVAEQRRLLKELERISKD